MKKLLVTLVTLIAIYSIYYDLNIGTLPQATEAAYLITDSTNVNQLQNSELIIVEPGYTVLSIVEELHVGPINRSIQQIIIDFEQLNPGTNASNIQIGKSYLFPFYE